MTYILIVGETTEHDLDPLVEHLGPRAKEAIVTTAERLRAEGRVEERIEVFIKQLTIKFGPIPRATTDAVRAASPEQLDRWLERVLTATTLEDIFA